MRVTRTPSGSAIRAPGRRNGAPYARCCPHIASTGTGAALVSVLLDGQPRLAGPQPQHLGQAQREPAGGDGQPDRDPGRVVLDHLGVPAQVGHLGVLAEDGAPVPAGAPPLGSTSCQPPG